MLVTDAHGGFGGIAQYNRDVIEAMSGFDFVEEIEVLPLAVADPAFTAPRKARYATRRPGGRLAFLARSALRAVSPARIDLVWCAHVNLMPVAAMIAKIRRAPLVLAIYGIDAWTPPASRATMAALARADAIASISQLTLDRFLNWSPAPGAATFVLPNAIHAEHYAVGEKNPALVEKFGLAGRAVVMTFGRISASERYKGFDEIIDLLPRLREARPDLVYMVAGDGDDRPRLEAKAREIGVADMTVFTGRVPEDSKADYYRLADCYAMPSHGEGFGFVVLEALACGVPVVASTLDGTREAVRGGELGAVVDPADADALANAILRSLRQPKAIPPGLAYFSMANFAGRLERVILSVGKNRGGGLQ